MQIWMDRKVLGSEFESVLKKVTYIFQGGSRNTRVSTLQNRWLHFLGFFCVLVSYHANRNTITLKMDALLSFLYTELNARASNHKSCFNLVCFKQQTYTHAMKNYGLSLPGMPSNDWVKGNIYKQIKPVIKGIINERPLNKITPSPSECLRLFFCKLLFFFSF